MITAKKKKNSLLIWAELKARNLSQLKRWETNLMKRLNSVRQDS